MTLENNAAVNFIQLKYYISFFFLPGIVWDQNILAKILPYLPQGASDGVMVFKLD